jgi:hypothetical protein
VLGLRTIPLPQVVDLLCALPGLSDSLCGLLLLFLELLHSVRELEGIFLRNKIPEKFRHTHKHKHKPKRISNYTIQLISAYAQSVPTRQPRNMLAHSEQVVA